MKRLLIGASVVGLGLGAGWWLTHLERAARTTAHATSSPPAIGLRGVDLIEYGAGSKLWDLKASEVSYDPDGRVATLHDIRARFWEQGRVVSTAQSPLAVFDTRGRDLRMQGGIRVDSTVEDGHIAAREVVWSAASQSLHASGDVQFQRGPSWVRAPELWGNRSLRRVRLGSPTQARIRLFTGLR
jgi:LPS export ABC transporter protein LptC